MRELHVVALSEDGRSVLLASSPDTGKPSHRVAVDDRLLAAVRGDLPRPGEGAPRESALTPKEIQARLRAGETPEEIARAAGVPVARVERFSGPVVSERARVVDAARAAYLVRGRRGPSALPLGEAVDLALAATPSIREGSVDWSARRVDDGAWVVTVSWHARARNRSASWRWDPARKELTAVDAASAALGHNDPDAEERQPAPRRAPARAAKAAGASTRSRTTRAAATTAKSSSTASGKASAKAGGKAGAKTAAKPGAKAGGTTASKGAKATAAAKGTTAKKAAKTARAAATKATSTPAAKRASKPTAKPATKSASKAAGRAATKSAGKAAGKAVGKAGSTSAKARGSVAERGGSAAATKAASRRTGTAKASAPALRVVPPPSDGEPAQRPRSSGRASVPGWADVLLSTAPPERD